MDDSWICIQRRCDRVFFNRSQVFEVIVPGGPGAFKPTGWRDECAAAVRLRIDATVVEIEFGADEWPAVAVALGIEDGPSDPVVVATGLPPWRPSSEAAR